MFDIHSITLTNFRSYKGTHKFKFPTVNGLYYLTGKNLLEPTLGANGAGKSTFLDAITWCLYGRTARGLKANDVLTWHNKTGAQVALELTVGEQRYQIKRTQKPNTLLIDDKPVDQKELETHIRLNYAAFTHSVLNPQFGTSFFSLSASDKLTLFSDFMGLDFWLVKADEALKLSRQQEADIAKLQDTITHNEGQLAAIEEDIARLKPLAASFKAEKEAQLRKLEVEYVEQELTARKLTKSLYKAEKNFDILRREEAPARARVENSILIRDNRLGDVQKLASQISGANHHIGEAKKAIDRLKSLGTGHCPHCEQYLKTANIHKAIELHQKIIAANLEELEKINKVREQRMRDLVRVKEQLAVNENALQAVKDEAAHAKSLVVKKNLQIDSAEKVLENIKKRIAENAAELDKNPHMASLENKRASRVIIRAKLDNDLNSVELLNSDYEATSFWARGFKRIRLYIIEQAFQTLELEVNNCLAQLGMSDWSVSFDIERENKSGGITKGFVVMIKSPANKEPVRWESWSGGETQRLQLAGDLGLANLIMQQAGLRSEIEFYDEPSTHLSPEGMMDLADTLHDRAINEGKRIWIADHAAISSFGEFEGIITARKDENGSSITSV